jgi:hypothetical protein
MIHQDPLFWLTSQDREILIRGQTTLPCLRNKGFTQILSNLVTFPRESGAAGATSVLGCGKSENIEKVSVLPKGSLQISN